MKTISNDRIEATMVHISQLTPKEGAGLIRQMSEEQEAVLRFLLSTADGDQDDERDEDEVTREQEILASMGLIIWQVMKAENPNIAAVSPEAIQAAIDNNDSEFEWMESELDEETIQTKLDEMIESSNQRHLLRFIIEEVADLIAEAAEDDSLYINEFDESESEDEDSKLEYVDGEDGDEEEFDFTEDEELEFDETEEGQGRSEPEQVHLNGHGEAGEESSNDNKSPVKDEEQSDYRSPDFGILDFDTIEFAEDDEDYVWDEEDEDLTGGNFGNIMFTLKTVIDSFDKQL